MDIDSKIKEIAMRSKRILQEYPVKSAWVFGSTITGEVNSDSDVDILIEFNSNNESDSALKKVWQNRMKFKSKESYKNEISLFDIVQLQLKLSKELEREVDIVDVKNIKKRYRPNIISQRVKIYDKKD